MQNIKQTMQMFFTRKKPYLTQSKVFFSTRGKNNNNNDDDRFMRNAHRSPLLMPN